MEELRTKEEVIKLADRFFYEYDRVHYTLFMSNLEKGLISVEAIKDYLEDKFEFYIEELNLVSEKEYQAIIDEKQKMLKKNYDIINK